MVWHEPKEHLTDCYFCLVSTKVIGKKNWQNFSHPSIPSAIRPNLHSDEFPPPVFNGFLSSEDDETGSEEECMDMEYKKTDTEFEDSSTESKKAVLQQFNQSELNDLVRDLDLSKQAAEILASRLNEKHVLHSSAKVSFYRKRDEVFLPYFKEEKQLVYCDNVSGLLRRKKSPQPKRVATLFGQLQAQPQMCTFAQWE